MPKESFFVRNHSWSLAKALDSSVSLGAPRQRPVRHETRRHPGADPAPWMPARRHVLLRDLHLAHHRQRPAGRPPSRMGSSGWCSPTRPPLLPLLPTISIYVLWALQRAQQLDVLSRNRLWPAVFRCRWPLFTRHCKCTEMGTACGLDFDSSEKTAARGAIDIDLRQSTCKLFCGKNKALTCVLTPLFSHSDLSRVTDQARPGGGSAPARIVRR